MRKPVATVKGGECLAFPDTCNQPIPSPPGGTPMTYPNKGSCASANNVSTKVFAENKAVIVEDSKIPNSSGDEPGCAQTPTPKGLQSMTNMKEVVFKSFSSKVRAEGKGVVYASATTAHNGSGNQNAPAGNHNIPSQTKVWSA